MQGLVMYYIIYKITNQINGKYYIGRHATKDINDSYMGSGTGIKNAIAKYGKENFTKEIIAEANTAEELWDLEKDIVNDSVVKDPMSYNNAYGGKHYLHGLKEYNFDAFIEHQSKAGKQYAKNFTGKTKEWHAAGGYKSSRMRSEQYTYRITTNEGEEYIVNGLEFKELCMKKDWNYNTLHWKKSMGKYISRGKHKGFLVEQLSTYKEMASLITND
jgi:predicted GIY-YIG superfamily endonuclease